MRKPSKYICRLLCLILALAGLIGATTLALKPAGRASAQAPGPRWSLTGSLNVGRFGHTATLLPNGQVLVAGGIDAGQVLSSAELYDPATGTWRATGPLNIARGGLTATMLPNGQVLVAGGITGGPVLNSAELYDPATGTWRATGVLNIARGEHTATLLPNGQVLVAGGITGGTVLSSAELYDPVTGTWSLTGNLNTGIFFHAATLLQDGKILVAGGGNDLDPDIPLIHTAELYDPATGTWSRTGKLNEAHSSHTATLLPNGWVLVAGGTYNTIFRSAELYDPFTGAWSGANSLARDRSSHTATLLLNGQVLIAGGTDDNSAELYDPATRQWSDTSKLNTRRYLQTATLLASGKVLAAGGNRGNINPIGSNNSAELFDLGLPQSGTVTSVSAASFSLLGLASEAITASFGARLATATRPGSGLPPPLVNLAGTTVRVKDSAGIERFAPLFFVSPTQVNYQIPQGTAAGAATVTITSGDGTVSSGVALIKAVAPSLFTANGNGQGVAAAVAVRVKADGSQQFEPVAQFDAAQNRFIARPLDLGPETDQVYLILFGTGIRHRSSLSSVIATIGGAYAEVSFAGAQGAFLGSDQINVRVPRSLAGRGEVDVLLTVEAQMANAARVNFR